MTKEEINKFLAGTKVYVAGKSKEIQEKLLSLGYEWCDGDTKISDTHYPFLFIYPDMSFAPGSSMAYFSNHEHREISVEDILSLELTEPDYRPFKNKNECWQEMLKHQPFAWIKHKSSQIYYDCRYVCSSGIMLASFDKAYKDYTFVDGTPFGIKEE